MNKIEDTLNKFDIPIFLVLFFIIGISGAVLLSKIISSASRQKEKIISEIFNSCKHNKYYVYENKKIRCNIINE